MFKFVTVNTSNQDNIIKIQGARKQDDKKEIAGIGFQNLNPDTLNTQDIASICTKNPDNINTSNNDVLFGDLVFSTTNNNKLQEKMRLDYKGFIGINTSTPTELLTVNGNAIFTSNVTVQHTMNTPCINFTNNDRNLETVQLKQKHTPTIYHTQKKETLLSPHTTFIIYDVLHTTLQQGLYKVSIHYQIVNGEQIDNNIEIRASIDDYIWHNSIITSFYDQSTQITTSPIQSDSYVFDLNKSEIAIKLEFACTKKNTQIGLKSSFIEITEIKKT